MEGSPQVIGPASAQPPQRGNFRGRGMGMRGRGFDGRGRFVDQFLHKVSIINTSDKIFLYM